jgi:hypothetical protein
VGVTQRVSCVVSVLFAYVGPVSHPVRSRAKVGHTISYSKGVSHYPNFAVRCQVPPSQAFEWQAVRVFGSLTAPADRFGDILRTLRCKYEVTRSGSKYVVMIRSLLRSLQERWESSDLSLPVRCLSFFPSSSHNREARKNKVIGSSYLLIRNTTWTWRCRSLLQVMHASYSVAEGTQLFWGGLDRPHPIPVACVQANQSERLPDECQVFRCGCALDSSLCFRLTNLSGSEPLEAEFLLPSLRAMLHRARPARLA